MPMFFAPHEKICRNLSKVVLKLFDDFQSFRRGPCTGIISSGASGDSLHGGASFRVEKAHFAAWKKGPENSKNEVKLRPPLCRPLKHSMIIP